ncbi:amidohydrolase [Cnuibacter physcomitrellae]|uniref:Amidohydrolase n=1 Tax=Cnuibacter physcomitrellae TaxID=1619308 RepID=A0A1X9LK97_9MICO|nr:amidohydrolase family protein [Cnuibacter physcomitrellae]ARJ04902.1 amidohydrolase [Cnuibacter physcomitrellae]GGI41614.1 amidohydrolase [Cnuibacter physcomitrellae]
MTDTTLLRGARLLGAEAPVDVEVSEGVITRIVAAGDGHGDEVLEVDGVLLPGLWDNHVHLGQWAAYSRRLDVSAAESPFAAATAIGEGLRSRPVDDEGPFVAVGFRDALWTDAPVAAILDAVAGDVPVVVVSADLHAVWLSTAALRRFGVEGDGLLREEAAFAVHRTLDDLDDVTLDRWVAQAGRRAAARGVVGVVDLEMTWGPGHWRRRAAEAPPAHRVEVGIYPQHLDRAIAEGLRTGDALDEDGLVTVGPFKVITDGSLNTRTAHCVDPYPGLHGAGARGMQTVPPDELVDLLTRARAGGLRAAVHAIGDRAGTIALDAFETSGCAGSVEHAQLLTASDVPRFAALGVTASVQPEHAMDDRDVADRYWSGRTERSFPLASLVRSGARLALGSDAPVAPLDPWIAIAAAVTRARDGRTPWHPEQAIDVDAALAASARVGRVRPQAGDPADLVVVADDPRAAATDATGDRLRAMSVALTMLAGRITHRG